MAQKKPTPKTQKEISKSLKKPYDPNIGTNDNSNTENRGNQLSFRGDTTKPFTLGIKDIDEAIYFYFTEVIKPFVIQNDVRIPVPIIYGSPEKWKAIQKDGYFRDKNGAIMSPLLVFKRDNLTPNRNIGNKLDANNPHLYSSMVKNYSTRNFYSPFDILNNIKPEKEQYAIVIPDYVTITYSCAIYTYYVEQMNKIVEALNYAANSYWGDPSRFNFNAQINSFATSVEVSDGKDRAVKSNFEIKLNGYIIPDVLQKDINAIKKIPSVTKTVFGIEVVKNINNLPPSNI